ncbi:MAG: PKD domain-containing protein [bacterium]
MRSFGTLFAVIPCCLLAALWLAGCSGGSGKSFSGGRPVAGSYTPAEMEIEAVLNDIEAYSAPAGADPAVFEMLKNELMSKLRARGLERLVNKAPTGDSAKVTDLSASYVSGAVELTWSEKLVGDTNADGEVGVADITPIALNFNRSVTEAEFLRRIDADGNGEIGVSDITPIAIHFLETLSGYNVMVGLSSDVAEASLYLTAPRDTTEFDDKTQPYVQYSAVVDQPDENSFYFVVPLDSDSAEGTASNGVQCLDINIGVISPRTVEEGDLVTFAANVFGADPLTYSWNFGGGADPNTSEEASPEATIGSVGSYDCNLTVSRGDTVVSRDFTLDVFPQGSLQPPDIPQNLTASKGTYTDKVVLTWDAAARADGYIVTRSKNAAGTFVPIPGSPTDQLQLEDTSIPDGDVHWYKVTAYNQYGTSDPSPAESGYISFPRVETVTASDGSFSGWIRITWTGIPEAAGYRVERADNSNGPFSQVAGSPTSEPYFDDTSAAAGEFWWYRVIALYAKGQAVPSDSDRGFVGLPAPSIAATDGLYQDKVSVGWNDIPGALNYHLYRADAIDGTYQRVGGNLFDTSFDDTTIPDFGTYWYKVCAVSTEGEGEYSNIDSGYAYLAPPTNLTATFKGTDNLKLSWDSSGMVVHIFRRTGTTGNFAPVPGSPIFGNNFTDNSAEVRVDYQYAVANQNAIGVGALSPPVDGSLLWRQQYVDGNEPDNLEVGRYSSMKFDSAGRPSIAYYSQTHTRPQFARYDGGVWTVENIPTAKSNAGTFTTLALDRNGNPVIAYKFAPSGLEVASYNGTDWEVTEVTDNGGDYASIALDSNDYPAIAHCNTIGSALYYSYFDGASWNTDPLLSGLGSADHTDLIIDANDQPWIAYRAPIDQIQKIATNPGSGWEFSEVDITPETGMYSSIALDGNGFPAIAYVTASIPLISLATFDGSEWSVSSVPDTSDVTAYVSLAFDQAGLPRIAYYEIADHDLDFVEFDGTEWLKSTVLGLHYVGMYNSLDIDPGGYSGISAFDESEANLIFVWGGPKP